MSAAGSEGRCYGAAASATVSDRSQQEAASCCRPCARGGVGGGGTAGAEVALDQPGADGQHRSVGEHLQTNDG